MISVILQSRRFCIGTKKGFRDRALSCGGGSGGNARCSYNKTAENIAIIQSFPMILRATEIGISSFPK